MEARDSSSSPAAGSGRDGSADEDGGMLTAAYRLAKDAAVLFQNGHFLECIEVLNQLLQKKVDDPKVLHNIAIAEYFRDGCSDPRGLLDVLNKVKKRSEDLARASGEQLEVTGNVGSSVISGSKGSGTALHQFSTPNAAHIAYADEFDTSIVTLNTAVILYHLHEYAHALSLLETLYQNIEPIDETTALHVCLLLLDVALACNDASRAADVIHYLEKSFGVGFIVNQGDSGTIAQNQSLNQTSKISAAASGLAVPDAFSSDSSASANASENSLDRTLSEDAIEYETLLSTLDGGGQNLTRPSSNDLSKISTDRPAPAIDLKMKMHLYKVRFLLLTRNLKAAKREVKLVMNIARGRDSSTALLLKSQLEYARGNHRKAIKLLMPSSNRTEAGMLSMFNNNLGCIYHQLRKHHASAVLFSKALRSSSTLRSEKPLKLSTFSQDKSLLIVYNCGLQHLACGKPLVAARCFHKASPVFYNWPLLWLRFAECCLLALEKGFLKLNGTSSSNGEEVKLHIVGSGKWRHVVIDVNSSNRHSDSIGENGLVSDDDQYRISIPFARQCLLNALHLLNGLELKSSNASSLTSASEEDDPNPAASVGIKNSNHKSIPASDSKASNATPVSSLASANGDSKENKGSTGSNTAFQSSLSSYEEICRKDNHIIKQAVLADLAYVELNLENPVKALSVAKTLEQLPDCSRMYAFLGRVYAAEALCHLNRPKEAAEHLSAYLSDGNSVDLPFSEEDREKWDAEKVGDSEELNNSISTKSYSAEESQGSMFMKPEEARGTLYINLAAMSAMQNDLEQACRFVTEALGIIPSNPRALLAAVYVDLLLGKTSEALVKLKKCNHVRFFPNGVTLSGSR